MQAFSIKSQDGWLRILFVFDVSYPYSWNFKRIENAFLFIKLFLATFDLFSSTVLFL